MNWVLALFAIHVPSIFFAAACCAGGGPRSFIQLNDFQKYEWALSTSLKEIYGRYNRYGELGGVEPTITSQTELGFGLRLTENLEASASIPMVRAQRRVAGQSRVRTGLGDIAAGVRLSVLDSLYEDDWYPNIKIFSNLSVPTGASETITPGGETLPSTGLGFWEFSSGIDFEKDLGWVLVGFTPSYTRRFSHTAFDGVGARDVSVREGDRIQFSVSGTIPMSQRFSFVLGGGQVWTFNRTLDSTALADSDSRVSNLFMGASYFVSRFWDLSLRVEGSVPFERGGMNESSYRTISISSQYAIY